VCVSHSVGEGIMLFSLGQVLGLLCNPAESTQKALSLPLGRPADAKEYQNLGSIRVFIRKEDQEIYKPPKEYSQVSPVFWAVQSE